MKKLLTRAALAAGTLGVIVGGAAAFSAFEAHVINVTARIENALDVVTDSISFGTVFPQEYFTDKTVVLSLSDSFVEQRRVNGVDYHIRQKPKCAVTEDDGETFVGLPTATGEVVPDGNGGYTVECPAPPEGFDDNTQEWGALPLLCPYLSKDENTTDGDEIDNDTDLAAFHQPFEIDGEDVLWNETTGRLNQLAGDSDDNWIIDLAVPCFEGQCAQDWPDFVLGLNPNAGDPYQWVLPVELEHKIFGCDLWFEVEDINTPLPV